MGDTLPARSGRWLWLVVATTVLVVCAAAALAAWAQGVRGWFLLMWSGFAGAVVFSASFVVPWALSRIKRLSAQRAAALEEAVRLEEAIREVMRPLSVPGSGNRGADGGGGSPAALLRAGYEVVRFTGRRDELRDLRSWARGSVPGMVRLVTGPAGMGKTRLAVEFAARLAADGWRCGLLNAGQGGRAMATITAAGVPTLLVVDYAEASVDLVPLLTALAAHEEEPVIRVLLLARALGGWWQPDGPLHRHAAVRDALADAEAVSLGPLTFLPHDHQEAFGSALKAFAGRYGMPTPAVRLRPTQGDVPVLLLHAAALVAVLNARAGSPDAQVAATWDVVKELLGHEARYWADTAVTHGLDRQGIGDGTYPQIAAIAGLLGAGDETQARLVLRRLPDLAGMPELTMGAIAGWLRELYPATDSSWLGSIQPDLLLEYLVTWVFGESRTLTDAAFTGLPEDRAYHALIVLARALDHYQVPAAGLLRRLLTAEADVLALPAVRLARNLDSPAMGQVIAAVVADAPISERVMAAVAADLRETSIALMPAVIAVYLRVGIGQIANGQVADATKTAAVLMDFAHQLAQAGLLVAEVDALRATVVVYRALEQAQPRRHRAYIAQALSNLGAVLHSLGLSGEAISVQAEAVDLYRKVEQGRPVGQRENLAWALYNLGTFLGGAGQELEEVSVDAEAVKLYRAAERKNPGRYRAYLAQALGNLGGTLSNLGRMREAEPTLLEAVDLYRKIDRDESGRLQARLASTLLNLGTTLHRLGRAEEAESAMAEAVATLRTADQAGQSLSSADLANAFSRFGNLLGALGRSQEAEPVLEEAVEHYREAEQATPGRHRVSLAATMSDHGEILRALGREGQAEPVLEEAVAHYREAEQAEPGRHRVMLAETLARYGRVLRSLGRERRAEPVLAEAVAHYREAEQAEPGPYRARLARALVSFGTTVSQLGHDEQAAPVLTEAVELYQEAEQAEPGRCQAEIAATLASLGATLNRLGHHDQALSATSEAIKLYRALVEDDPAGYRQSLADALAALSGILLDLGRLDEAQSARSEADLHGHAR
jgi:tetratricopeptide (TPR) repeat protein